MSSSNDSVPTDPPASDQPRQTSSFINEVMSNKIDALLAFTRLVTVACTIFYVVPIFGAFGQYSCYQKALIASAATSALRLHQRVPNFQLNYQFLQMLGQEDSAHYLAYSIIFLFASQMTMVLLPISLFATVNLISFVIAKMQSSGHQGTPILTKLNSFNENYRRYMLQMIALAEITLMPITVFSVFTGNAPLLTPFTYSRFIAFRYASRRNPYNRLMFADLRFTLQRAAYSPSCPVILRNVINQFISIVSRFAPDVQVSQ